MPEGAVFLDGRGMAGVRAWSDRLRRKFFILRAQGHKTHIGVRPLAFHVTALTGLQEPAAP